MKKESLIEFAKINGLNPKLVVSFVSEAIKSSRTNWASLFVKIDAEKDFNDIKYTSCGYRKYTTGEYVSNKYRNNFGWKNTYYESAKLEISLNPRFF